MIESIIRKQQVVPEAFNQDAALPHNLRLSDLANTMTDVYEFFFEINAYSVSKGWGRIEDIIQKQALSNFLSNLINSSLANHSKELVVNLLPNGHPDLIPKGLYAGNRIASSDMGLEVKATNNQNGAVDMHGAREQDLCVFVYDIESDLEKPLGDRKPLTFTAIFIGHVIPSDYRKNDRGVLGTRTATLDRAGLERYRSSWVYATQEQRKRKWAKDLGITPLK